MDHAKLQIDTWIKSISKGLSRISKQRETELATIIQTGTGTVKDQAMEELVRYNTLPIAKIALDVYYSFPNAKKVNILDLAQRGVEVFYKKLNTFKPEKGRLITYYSRDVKTQMQRFIMRYALAVVQGSYYLQFLASKKVNSIKKLQTELQRHPTNGEVLEDMKISERTLNSINTYTSIDVGYFENNNEDENSIIHTSEVRVPSTAKIGNDISVLDNLIDILREKLDFLTDDEFYTLITQLAMNKELDNLDIIKKFKGHLILE